MNNYNPAIPVQRSNQLSYKGQLAVFEINLNIQLIQLAFFAMTNIRHFWVASNSRNNQCRELKQCEKQFFKIN
jgi:hypothetical protein